MSVRGSNYALHPTLGGRLFRPDWPFVRLADEGLDRLSGARVYVRSPVLALGFTFDEP